MIGIGVITCNRPEFFSKCIKSIKREWYDYIVVVNDGDDVDYKKNDQFHHYIKTKGGEGVGKAKNKALRHLLGHECDYIILVEDDMLFKGNIFKEYINAYKKTGIEHFMFGYHGPANKDGVSGGPPKPRKVIQYSKDLSIALNMHCVGAVCFYTRNSLEAVGVYDEKYTNAFEHVDHSYELSKQGFTTPYWWWPDIANSLDYVQEQACSEENSAIRPREDWQDNISTSWEYFTSKHGTGPVEVKDSNFNDITSFLKIKKPKKKISFIVHYRHDTEEREKNFNLVYNYYKDVYPGCEFVFVEDDSKKTIDKLIKKGDKYIFYKNDGIYNKCLSYNKGLKAATHDIVCFLDIDCVVSIDSLLKAVNLSSNKDIISIGYNRTAIYLEHELKKELYSKKGVKLFEFIESNIDLTKVYTGYRNNLYAVGNVHAVGGCLIGSKDAFNKINGFNPNFIGWGYEDNEIISRAGLLDVNIATVGDSSSRWFLFHLPHEDGMVGIKDKNNHEFYKHNEQEVRKVESMNKKQMLEYIKSW